MQEKIGTVPTLVYPESDGEPMAETPKHQQVMIDCMDILRNHFYAAPDVYIGGNMLLYYEEGNPRKSISPDVFMVRGLSKKDLRTYVLGLELGEREGVLRLYNPATDWWLSTSQKRAEVESLARQAAEARAEEEARARRNVEAELAKACETLERLQGAE